MKRTILGMTEAGEPLILEALEALRLYREAKLQDAYKRKLIACKC